MDPCVAAPSHRGTVSSRALVLAALGLIPASSTKRRYW